MRARPCHPTDHPAAHAPVLTLAMSRRALVSQTRKPGAAHLPAVQLAGFRGTGAPWQPLHRLKSSPMSCSL